MTDELVVRIPPAFKPLWRPKRYKVYYGGRGGAKSWAFAMTLVLMGAERPIRVLCTREYQKSIRESVHKLLEDAISRCGLSAFYDIQQQKIRGQNGSEFFFEGLRNDPKGIKSLEGLTHVWCEEAEAISEESWKFLVPTIRQEDSEIWLSFNPHWEQDPTFQRFVAPFESAVLRDGYYEDDRYYVAKVSYRDNPYFPQVLRDEMEADRAKDENLYRHVWEGECRIAAHGAIFAEELRQMTTDGRITQVPIVRSQPVTTFWDLGRRDTMVIIFAQQIGAEMRLIDYYENRFKPLRHYAKVVREKDYVYDEHYLPHDVEVEELGSGLSRRTQLEELGIKPIQVVPRVQRIEDGIEALRARLSELWIDETRCAPLLLALKAYSYEYDERTGEHKDKPGPKWATNPVDALRQWAQGYDGPAYWPGDTGYRAPNVA